MLIFKNVFCARFVARVDVSPSVVWLLSPPLWTNSVLYVSTLSRTKQWFQEQEFPESHAQLLMHLSVKQPSAVWIDNMALRSSPYDSQMRGRMMPTLITCLRAINFIQVSPQTKSWSPICLPEVFWALKDWNIRFALGDAAYDSKKVQTIARREHRSVFGSPRNQKNEYDSRVVEGDIWKTVMGLAYQHWTNRPSAQNERTRISMSYGGYRHPLHGQ